MKFPSDTELEKLQKPLRDTLNELYMNQEITKNEFKACHAHLDLIHKTLEQYLD